MIQKNIESDIVAGRNAVTELLKSGREIEYVMTAKGAGGSLKLLLGGGIVPDYILVSARNYERARELYEVYLLNETETQYSACGEEQ